STLVEDVTGPHNAPDGIPDLVVSNSQSNNLFLLPGVGGGFFDDRKPTITPLPSSPGTLVAFPSDPTGGIVLNPHAKTVTIIPEFSHPSDLVEVFPVGTLPVAAVAGDFNGDGRTDLIVANNGSGDITFLQGEASGFAAAVQFQLDRLLPHPTALATLG